MFLLQVTILDSALDSSFHYVLKVYLEALEFALTSVVSFV